VTGDWLRGCVLGWMNARCGLRSSPDRLLLPDTFEERPVSPACFPLLLLPVLFPGPFAVRRLGRPCPALGPRIARARRVIPWTRSDICDDLAQTSIREIPLCGAGASAAARTARRRERSELVPVGAAFSVPLLAGQKGDISARCQRPMSFGLPAAGCGQCDWPHRRQGGRFREIQCPKRIPARDLEGVPSIHDGDSL
jgi:hypothetical protein